MKQPKEILIYVSFSLIQTESDGPPAPFPFQILDVLCSLCVCNGVAVRANQNLICDNLLPNRDLLLQTRLINDVQRYKPNSQQSFAAVSHTHVITGDELSDKCSPKSFSRHPKYEAQHLPGYGRGLGPVQEVVL